MYCWVWLGWLGLTWDREARVILGEGGKSRESWIGVFNVEDYVGGYGLVVLVG